MSAKSAGRREAGWYHRVRSAALAVFAVLGLAAPAAASPECPNDGNLISNCSFEYADTSFWTLNTQGSLVRSATYANTLHHSGLAPAENNFGDNYIVSIEACVPDVDPFTAYVFGAWARAATTGNTLFGIDCIISIFEAVASDPPCQGAVLDELNGSGGVGFDAFASVPGQSEYETGTGPSDIGIGMGCSREVFDGAFDLYIDDVFLIPTHTVYLSAFESGDTCGWDVSVGGGGC